MFEEMWSQREELARAKREKRNYDFMQKDFRTRYPEFMDANIEFYPHLSFNEGVWHIMNNDKQIGIALTINIDYTKVEYYFKRD